MKTTCGTMKITMLSALALVLLFSGCKRKSGMPCALSPEAETLRLSIDEQMAFIADTNFPVKVERLERAAAAFQRGVIALTNSAEQAFVLSLLNERLLSMPLGKGDVDAEMILTSLMDKVYDNLAETVWRVTQDPDKVIDVFESQLGRYAKIGEQYRRAGDREMVAVYERKHGEMNAVLEMEMFYKLVKTVNEREYRRVDKRYAKIRGIRDSVAKVIWNMSLLQKKGCDAPAGKK